MADDEVVDLGIPGIEDAVLIGAGGSASVYRARQSGLHRLVAVKVISASTGPDTVRRFEREARALGALSEHPGIVTVYDVGATRTGRPYLVMQYCPNGSVGDRLAAEGPFPVEDARALAAEVAATVADTHDLGIVHRDLKPANVLIATSGRPVVADFGIATLADATGAASTAMAFTPSYAPPETMRGEPPSHAGDVYSLGAMLYHLLLGRAPYAATDGSTPNLIALARRIDTEEPEDLRDHGIPDSLASIVEAAMAKNPLERPSMRELAGVLARPTSALPTTRREAPADVAKTTLHDPGLAAALGGDRPGTATDHVDRPEQAVYSQPGAPRRGRRSGWFFAAVGVVVVLLIAIVAAALPNGPDGGQTFVTADDSLDGQTRIPASAPEENQPEVDGEAVGGPDGSRDDPADSPVSVPDENTSENDGDDQLLHGATELAAGFEYTCALLTDGTATCWGSNSFGALGNGRRTSGGIPTPVEGLTNATAITANLWHTCALLADGTITCWGNNRHGQLGDGTTTDSAVPTPVGGLTGANAVAAGGDHTCALLTNGTITCWGNNEVGQLGDGTTIARTEPAPVNGLTNDAAAIAAGRDYTCALLIDGTVNCWGDNAFGQLGDGTRTDRTEPTPVVGLTNAAAITAGENHTCALLADGALACWGSNVAGRLGDGTTTSRALPVPVPGLTNATASAASGHTCALLADQTITCWGDNEDGQLGDGTTVIRTEPTPVTGLTNATAVTAGEDHTCALLTDETVTCWGNNEDGQLGDGTTSATIEPVRVVGT